MDVAYSGSSDMRTSFSYVFWPAWYWIRCSPALPFNVQMILLLSTLLLVGPTTVNSEGTSMVAAPRTLSSKTMVVVNSSPGPIGMNAR